MLATFVYHGFTISAAYDDLFTRADSYEVIGVGSYRTLKGAMRAIERRIGAKPVAA